MEYMIDASTINIAIVAKASGVSKLPRAIVSSPPRPRSPMTNSPTTAPVIESVSAVRSPARMTGSASGSSKWISSGQKPAPIDACGVERVAVECPDTDRRVDDHWEEDDQRAKDGDRLQPIAKPQHEQWRDGDGWERLACGDERLDGTGYQAASSDAVPKRHGDGDAERESGEAFLECRPAIAPEDAAFDSAPERVRDIDGCRKQVFANHSSRREQLPETEQKQADDERRQDANSPAFTSSRPGCWRNRCNPNRSGDRVCVPAACSGVDCIRHRHQIPYALLNAHLRE